ncbi:MAG: N-acetyltransferase [Bacteroidales bacterium]|nr:N-acetyltransferase [Bacteroidota bacterium]MBL6949594.1 N-acetyltransferase [Bacteroidales bacterium]
MQLTIRPETKQDYSAIKKVNDLAFKQENEGTLIEKLRINPEYIPELSLVAEIDGAVRGHILFFPLHVNTDKGGYQTISLAPMAVYPDWQRKGIGGQLIREGLLKVEELGHKSVVVVGHPEYYPRFGFRRASEWNVKVPFPCPDEALMAIEFEKGNLKPGVIKFTPEYFDAL